MTCPTVTSPAGVGEVSNPMTTEPAPGKQEPLTEREMLTSPPWVIIEHLVVAGHELVRVVATSRDEGEAHQVASALADVGLRVWLVDLWGGETGATISRYVGEAGAAWLHGHGEDATERGAGEKLTEAGR